ncbi:MAG: hypothetical protein HY010_13085 [Acidobacteria bacterium]|nr:hypothetical protein [Acidobacteriota bacterium]
MTGAYQFVVPDSSTTALRTRLHALGGWQWSMGDSHWYGDYVACSPFPGVRIRICDFPDRVAGGYRYRADVRLANDCQTAMPAIDEAFRALLAQAGARDVEEIEWFD